MIAEYELRPTNEATNAQWFRVGDHADDVEFLTSLHTGNRDAGEVWAETLAENGNDEDAALNALDAKLYEWLNSNAQSWNLFATREDAEEYRDENEMYGAEVIPFEVHEATGAFMETVGIGD